MPEELGIYIHIPFCRVACSYCDFHFSTKLNYLPEMCNAIRYEIISRANEWKEKKIRSIYFGGGTPGLLPGKELELFFKMFSEFDWMNNSIEITLEANPENVNEKNIRVWQNSGINRISLGIQSLDDEELKWMRRTHNAQQSIKALDLLTRNFRGIISVDLIFGTPCLIPEKLEKQLTLLVQYKIPHISCYQLTVEQKTLLEKQITNKKTFLPSEDSIAEQFLFIHDFLTKRGYEHYEISNYALEGYKSVHNSSYWKGFSYSGFGPSAHSYDGLRKRRKNICNNHEYMRRIRRNEIFYEEEFLDDRSYYNDYILTRLRTCNGLNLTEMKNIFSSDKIHELQYKIKSLPDSWFLKSTDTLALTPEGMLCSDYVIRRLFD